MLQNEEKRDGVRDKRRRKKRSENERTRSGWPSPQILIFWFTRSWPSFLPKRPRRVWISRDVALHWFSVPFRMLLSPMYLYPHLAKEELLLSFSKQLNKCPSFLFITSALTNCILKFPVGIILQLLSTPDKSYSLYGFANARINPCRFLRIFCLSFYALLSRSNEPGKDGLLRASSKESKKREEGGRTQYILGGYLCRKQYEQQIDGGPPGPRMALSRGSRTATILFLVSPFLRSPLSFPFALVPLQGVSRGITFIVDSTQRIL